MSGDAVVPGMSKEFGIRAKVCDHFRWMPGMRGISPRDGDGGSLRIIEAADGSLEWHAINLDGWSPEEAVPDVGDPATSGCLVALVGAAWGDAISVTQYTSGLTRVYRGNGHDLCSEAHSRGEALVAALENAP